MARKNSSTRFVLCVKNNEYPASLEMRKVYETVPDSSARSHRMIRVIDESGEDYLYPQDYFVPLELPMAVRRSLARTR